MMLLETFNLFKRIESQVPEGTFIFINSYHDSLSIVLTYKDKISPKEGCSYTKEFTKIELELMVDGIEDSIIDSMAKTFVKAIDLRYNEMNQECDG